MLLRTVTGLKSGFMSEIGESVVPEEVVEESIPKSLAQKMIAERVNEVKRKAPQNTMGGMPQFDPNSINELIQKHISESLSKMSEEHERREQTQLAEKNKQYLTKAADEIHQKIVSAKEDFPDIDEVLSDFDYDAYGHLAFLANDYPETAGIIYDFAKDPDKAARFVTQLKISPKTALAQFERLAKSVSDNLSAKRNYIKPDEPISRLKSSNIGVDGKRDPSKLSVADYRKMPFNRG